MNRVWVHDMQILYFSELFRNFRGVVHIIISEYKLISFFGGLSTILRYQLESEGCPHYYIGECPQVFFKNKRFCFEEKVFIHGNACVRESVRTWEAWDISMCAFI